jgi:hypothetical protein
MQLSELRTAVRTRLGNPATDGFFSDANLTDLVNEALQAISTERDWPWLTTSTTFPTVAGTAAYTPTAGWMRTLVLCIDGYQPIEERQLAEIRSMPTADRGMPRYYAVTGDQIVLRDVPDGVYTITHDYVKVEPALTSDANTPLMPSQFHYSIVAKAAELASIRQRDAVRAGEQLAEYNAWVNRMLDNQRRTRAPKRIRVRPGTAL